MVTGHTKKKMMFLNIERLPNNVPHTVKEGAGHRHSHFFILYLINE
jgi:hypothetical protein